MSNFENLTFLRFLMLTEISTLENESRGALVTENAGWFMASVLTQRYLSKSSAEKLAGSRTAQRAVTNQTETWDSVKSDAALQNINRFFMTIFFQKSEKTLIGYWNEDPNSDQIRIEVRSIEKWLGEKIFGLLIKFKLLWRQTDVNRHVKVFVKVLQFSQFLKKDSLWCWCSKSKGHVFTIYWSLFCYFCFLDPWW